MRDAERPGPRAREQSQWSDKHRARGPALPRSVQMASNRQPRERWTPEAIRRELGAFLATCDGWPTDREFRDTGRTALLFAVRRHGGTHYWARTFGLRVPRSGRRRKWSEQRIADGILFVAGESREWPRWQAFRDAEMLPVWWAIRHHGGQRVWADRLGLRVR